MCKKDGPEILKEVFIGEKNKVNDYMIIEDIIWLESIVEKLAWKHQVLPNEVEEVLGSRCRFFKKENGKVEGEHLYNALGKTKNGRYLSVFFILKSKKAALIISARNMNTRERKRYGRK